MSEIQKCIEIHNQYAKFTPYANTMGDGFLYKTSPIFKKVRDLVLAANFTINGDLSEETNEYFLTQLFQLDRIYFDKKLFARQNFKSLSRIAQKFPDMNLTIQEVTTLECYSALLHESVHCLCQQYFGWKELNLKKHPEPETFIQQLILAESMAISTEFLVSVAYENPTERSLALLNSLGYIMPEDEMNYRQLQKIAGFDAALDWLFRGYFSANYFHESVAVPPGFAKTLRNKDTHDPRLPALAEAVMNIGFRVNKPFRNVTANTFFRLIGAEGGLKKVMAFDIQKALQDDSPIMRAARDIFSQYTTIDTTAKETYAKGS